MRREINPRPTRYSISCRRNSSVFAALPSPSFLPVVISLFSPSFLRRRKQGFCCARTACDLAKRWSRLAVAREAAGICKGCNPLQTFSLGFGVAETAFHLSFDKEMNNNQTNVRGLCSHNLNNPRKKGAKPRLRTSIFSSSLDQNGVKREALACVLVGNPDQNKPSRHVVGDNLRRVLLLHKYT